MSSLRLDLLYALRTLRKTPATTAVALAVLTLGIGANAAIFSVLDAALLRPLPFAQPQDLVQVERDRPSGRSPNYSEPRFDMVREEATTLSGVAAYDDLGAGFNLITDGSPQRLVGSMVSHNFFSVLGVSPLYGRDFTADDDRPGAGGVVILSHRLWRSHFGADPQAVGRTLDLNGEGHQIIGVMPASYSFPRIAELWLPFRIAYAEGSDANYLKVVGRTAEGYDFAAVEAELDALGRRVEERFDPEDDQGETLAAIPLQRALYGHLQPVLLVLLAAVAMVLLIACANLANLQLARSAARRQEMAIRTALGASSARLTRQLLTENLLLAATGGALGLLLAQAALRPLLALGPEEVASLTGVSLDGRMVLFTLGLSLATGLLFGLAPALAARRTDVSAGLKEGGAAIGGRSGRRLGLGLVTAEVALALVLLLGAGLLVKSFYQLAAVDTGLETSGVLTLRVSLPEARYGTAEALERFQSQVLDNIEAVPGVARAAFANSLPTTIGPDLSFAVVGHPDPDSDLASGGAQFRTVSPGYFEALGIPRLQGREFLDSDTSSSEPVVIINRRLAETHWPEGDALGQSLQISGSGGGPARIVGVVENVRELGATQGVPRITYIPTGQLEDGLAGMLTRLLPFHLVARAESGLGSPFDVGALTRPISAAVWAVDPQQPITNALTLDELLAAHLRDDAFNTLLLGILAAVALLLAAVGIYGVLAHLVGQRRREIGIRLALGASRRSIARSVVTQGLGAILAGVALGLATAAFSGRWIASLIHGADPVDPAVFALIAGLLILLSLVATYLPARRAARVDPLRCLREE
ncbi:MAG: ABC transporter permease [Acidobacteriota bacterium]